MENFSHTNDELETLLLKFNNRDGESFGNIYSLLFKELYYFHRRLYSNSNIDPEDLIQDIFFKIWSDKKLQFVNLNKLRAFLFTSISNSYKTLYNRNKTSSNVVSKMAYDDDYFTVYAVEAEVFSLIPTALGMLPEDCAESFKLFIEGYSIKEISEKMNKPLTTIYSQREKAISILKTKISSDKLFFILQFINF